MNSSLSQAAVIAALNEAFMRDPHAIRALLCNRVPCNRDLADDPFMQVNAVNFLKPAGGLESPGFDIGMLGILNGVLSAMGVPLVATKWEDGQIYGFCEYFPSAKDGK